MLAFKLILTGEQGKNVVRVRVPPPAPITCLYCTTYKHQGVNVKKFVTLILLNYYPGITHQPPEIRDTWHIRCSSYMQEIACGPTNEAAFNQLDYCFRSRDRCRINCPFL